MKNILVLLILLFISSNLFAQKGKIFSAGLAYSTFKDSDDDLLVENYAAPHISLGVDWIPLSRIGIGLELYKSVGSSKIKNWDFRIMANSVFRGKSRLQIPVYIGINFFGFKEKITETDYGGNSWMIKSGVRYYLTDDISIEGGLNAVIDSVSTKDGKEFDKAIGTIANNGLYVRVCYYLSNSN